MDEQEKKIEEALNTENTPAQEEAQTPKYVDRSEEAVQEEYVEPGAHWEGNAYTPADADAERKRVQAIIEQNQQHAEQQAEPSENTQEEGKKKLPRSRLIIGIVLALVLVAAIIFAVSYFTKKEPEPEPVQTAQDSEQTEETPQYVPYFAEQEDKTEEEAKAENFPREIAIPTPMEFFSAQKTFSEYTYNYFYVYGIVTGYDTIEGLRCMIVQTVLGNVVLLDSMFTIPDIDSQKPYYFYYLYAGYDASLGTVFGEYVDYSEENEGIPEIRSYMDGTYVVGKDLDAGEYFFSPLSADGAHIDLYADDRYIEKLVSETAYGGYFLTLEDGQILVAENVRFAVSTAISMNAPPALHDFMYRVGKDIEPGAYRITPDGTAGGTYTVYDSSNARTRQIVAEGAVEEDIYITVEEGQYLYLAGTFAYAVEPDEIPGEEEPDEPAEETEPTEEEGEAI